MNKSNMKYGWKIAAYTMHQSGTFNIVSTNASSQATGICSEM